MGWYVCRIIITDWYCLTSSVLRVTNWHGTGCPFQGMNFKCTQYDPSLSTLINICAPWNNNKDDTIFVSYHAFLVNGYTFDTIMTAPDGIYTPYSINTRI